MRPGAAVRRPAGSTAVRSGLRGRRRRRDVRLGWWALVLAVLVRQVWEVRRHLGLLVPGPVQEAMVAALDDDAHVEAQRARYRARRERLAAAVRAAGARIDHSEAGLYLWVTRDEDCWATIGWLAERGIVAAPGTFYGPAGARHVRIALTATDERIDAAVERLTA